MNRNLFGILIAGSLLCLPSMVDKVSAARTRQSVKITPSQVGQTVGGIGGGIVYYQDWLTNHPYREAVYDTLFNGLGISCLRMGNWSQEDNEKDNLVVTNDSIVYHAAKEYCGQNLPVVMACWSAPAYLKANNNINGSDANGKASLKKVWGSFIYNDYAKWWAESLNRYRKRGIYPDYISIQNEPDCDESSYATMVFNPEETNDVASYGKALAATHAEVNKLPNPPKFLGPDNLGVGWNQTQNYINKLDKKLLSGYAFHYYHSGVNGNDRYSHPNDFIEAMKGLADDLNDKPMFMTENSNLSKGTNLDCMYTAWFIANGFNINKLQYYLFWNLIWGDNGNGCISLQKWDSTYTDKWDKGMSIRPCYHGLRHFSKFVRPGMKLIGTWASSDQMTTCGFKSDDNSTYTLVFINQGKDEYDVSHDLDLDMNQYTSKVIVSVPEWNVYSLDGGAYSGSVYMPSHSVVTIVYTKAHPKVSPYVYVLDELANNPNWNNVSNWETKFVPWPTDTVLIKKGECKVANYTHVAPITVGAEGTLRLTGDLSIGSNIELYGGSLKVYTNSTGFKLVGAGIVVHQPSVFNVGHAENHFYVSSQISGEADLQKTGDGILDLLTNNNKFSGGWFVRSGTLRAAANNALGTGIVEVTSQGKLQVDAFCKISELRAQPDSTLLLNDNLQVTYAYLGGQYLKNGDYTSADFPDFIVGDGVLVVRHPYPIIFKNGKGNTEQKLNVDSAIVEYNYTWHNADSVEVDWNPHQPEGLNVEILPAEKSVLFSGTPTEPGRFVYKVSTISIEDSVYVVTGLFDVTELTDDNLLPSLEYAVRLLPSKVVKGGETKLFVTSPTDQLATVRIISPTGTVCGENVFNIRYGVNGIPVPIKALSAGVYLVTVECGIETATLKLVVE